ncbi:MAG TPA: hypothetical protein VFQ54_03630, partial [Thermomicrobiales bacterium]|nr:hypothetical protein [Thermomicrobiales bacterium]
MASSTSATPPTADARNSPGPAWTRGWGIAIAGAIVALILEAIFIGSYVGALHDPKPHDALPVGIVAPAQTASQLVQQIDAQAAGIIDPRVETDETALRHAIDERKIYGGLVFGPRGTTLIVADAAGSSAVTVLTTFAQGLATGQKIPLTVEHVHLLDSGDPRGLTTIYLVLAWVFGGYFCATVLTTLRGTGYASRGHAALRLSLLAGYGVLSGIVGALLAGPVIGAIDGHFLAIALSGTLIVFAVAATTMALQLVLGAAGTLLVMIAFVLLGNP